MGRPPCCEERGLKKGPWTPEEDQKLVLHIQQHGHGSWRALPKLAGLNRCGKSCRLRWTNYLRPDIKRGKFSQEEEKTILHLHSVLGNKWSSIASHLPGRTDNEIKNFWNTHLKKKLIQMGFDPMTHQPRTDDFYSSLPHLIALVNLKALIDYHNLSQNPMQSSYGGQTLISPFTADSSLQNDPIHSHSIHQMVNDLLESTGSGGISGTSEAQNFNETSIFKSNLDFNNSQPPHYQMQLANSFDSDERDALISGFMDISGGSTSGDLMAARSGQIDVAKETCSEFNVENYCLGFWPELSSESSFMHQFS